MNNMLYMSRIDSGEITPDGKIYLIDLIENAVKYTPIFRC